MSRSAEEYIALADPEAAALPAVSGIEPAALRQTRLDATWRALRHAPPSAWFGLWVIITYAAVAIFAPLLAPYGQAQVVGGAYEPWSLQFIFGTDQLGRDIFARMVLGARVSLMIAGSVVMISGVAGVLVGTTSGFFGGWRDVVVQKIVETFWAFPPILLAIAIVSLFGQNLPNLIVALTIQRWIPYARLTRAQALTLRSRDFV